MLTLRNYTLQLFALLLLLLALVYAAPKVSSALESMLAAPVVKTHRVTL